MLRCEIVVWVKQENTPTEVLNIKNKTKKKIRTLVLIYFLLVSLN